MADALQSLRRLGDVDYDVAPDNPDVRGWDVVLGNDETIGTVDDLLIDPGAGKVRYLDVDLDAHALDLDRARHVLVPIADAQLDTAKEEVVLSGLNRAALLKLPADHDASGGYDEQYRSHLNDEFKSKRMTLSAEELRVGRRVEHKGDVRVAKHVETEHVRQEVPLTREEVHVERRPVERAVGSAARLEGDEIVVPVMEEEAVIEKRPVVKEEIVIGKERVTTKKTVEADLRHEEVDVKPSSGDVGVRDDMKGRGGE